MNKKDIIKVCEEVDVVGAPDKIQTLINECYELPDEVLDVLHDRMLGIITNIARENDALSNRHMLWLKKVMHDHCE